VTVSVHNTTASDVSGRVQIHVLLSDGTLTTLSSENFTVAGGATIAVTLSAPLALSEIEDNPEPFPTAQ
jgi:hypothetical protein